MSKQDKHGIQNTRVYMGKQNIAEYNRVFNSTIYMGKQEIYQLFHECVYAMRWL